MIKQLENYLNCENHLRDNLTLLIETFVEYYGEERRQEIEKKFSKSLLIAYTNPKSIEEFLRKIKYELSVQILDEKIKIKSSNWTIKDLLNDIGFENINILPITYFKKFYDLYILGKNGRKEQFKENALVILQHLIPNLTSDEYEEMVNTKMIIDKYQNLSNFDKILIMFYINLDNAEKEYQNAFLNTRNLLKKINSDVSLDNISDIMKHNDVKVLIEYANELLQMFEEYQLKVKKYESYEKEIEYNNKLKKELEKKYYLELIEENMELLPENIKELIPRAKNDSKQLNVLRNYVKNILGYYLNSNSPLEAFSQEANHILMSQEESDWKKQSIIDRRIEFFKNNGFDLGNEYNDYVQNSEIKRIWPTVEQVEKFIESKNQLLNEFNNEYYTNLHFHKEVRDEINDHNLLDKNDSFDASLYTTMIGPTFVSPNIVKNQSGFDLFSLVIICCDSVDGIVDHNIIHELNHLYELSLQSVEDNSYKICCGWDMLDGLIYNEEVETDTLNQESSKRDYELFNEIINELIAQEIYQIMISKNQHIFDTNGKAKIKNTTSYENTLFLVKDFFQEFKKEILESRSNGNIEIIWNKVGKENFDELNSLFSIFYENFSGFKFINLCKSLKQNEDTEQTKVYYQLIKKRDEILAKMREYSVTKSSEIDDFSSKKL